MTYLQGDDIRIVRFDLINDVFSPVVPFKSPSWTVPVVFGGGVVMTQHVVTHHREYTWW